MTMRKQQTRTTMMTMQQQQRMHPRAERRQGQEASRKAALRLRGRAKATHRSAPAVPACHVGSGGPGPRFRSGPHRMATLALRVVAAGAEENRAVETPALATCKQRLARKQEKRKRPSAFLLVDATFAVTWTHKTKQELTVYLERCAPIGQTPRARQPPLTFFRPLGTARPERKASLPLLPSQNRDRIQYYKQECSRIESRHIPFPFPNGSTAPNVGAR